MLVKRITVLLVMVTALLLAAGTAVFSAEKPTIPPICKQCHQPADNVLRGMMGGVSGKAWTIQVNVGPAAWLVKFDENTKLVGAEKFSKIPKEKEIAVTYRQKDGSLYAESVSVKPAAKVAEEKLMKADELARLIALGPEKGNFMLVDSRPALRFNEGFIPGAINIYDADFDKNVEKLPKDKNRLLVFYCAGVT